MSPDKRKPPKRAKVRAAIPITPSPDDPHDIVYFERHPTDDPSRAKPGQEFIKSCPKAVRVKIYVTLVAVAMAPPSRFAGGGRWEAMHGDRPLLVIVTGMAKPRRTAFTDSDYRKVRALGSEYRRWKTVG